MIPFLNHKCVQDIQTRQEVRDISRRVFLFLFCYNVHSIIRVRPAARKGAANDGLKSRLHRAILSRDKSCDKIVAKLH